MFGETFRRMLKKLLKQKSEFTGRDMKGGKENLIREVGGAKGEFGFAKSNPIPVRFPWGEKEYLSRLRCPCGEPFYFQRIGSCGISPDNHMVDCFDLMCRKKEHRYFLYLDMYHSGMPSTSPKGLSLSTPAGVGTTVGVENFEKMTFEEMEERVIGCKE